MDAVEPDATFAHTTFQIAHHEGRHGHIADVQFGLRTPYFKPDMEPDLCGNVDGTCETGAVVDLPGSRAEEHRRILLSVFEPGFMRSQIHQFSFAIGLSTERNVIESAGLGTSH